MFFSWFLSPDLNGLFSTCSHLLSPFLVQILVLEWAVQFLCLCGVCFGGGGCCCCMQELYGKITKCQHLALKNSYIWFAVSLMVQPFLAFWDLLYKNKEDWFKALVCGSYGMSHASTVCKSQYFIMCILLCVFIMSILLCDKSQFVHRRKRFCLVPLQLSLPVFHFSLHWVHVVSITFFAKLWSMTQRIQRHPVCLM